MGVGGRRGEGLSTPLPGCGCGCLGGVRSGLEPPLPPPLLPAMRMLSLSSTGCKHAHSMQFLAEVPMLSTPSLRST